MPVRRIEDGNRPIIDPEEIAGHFKGTLRKLFRPDEQCTGIASMTDVGTYNPSAFAK
jgi:hypothetical protein